MGNFFKRANLGLLFLIFVFSELQLTDIQNTLLPILVFEPQISGVGSDRSANCATTTAPYLGNFGSIESIRQMMEQICEFSDCCLFIFLDGSAHYFDDFLRKLTGHYRLMYGTVNNHPHYVSRNCKNPDEYNGSCTYIWYSGYDTTNLFHSPSTTYRKGLGRLVS